MPYKPSISAVMKDIEFFSVLLKSLTTKKYPADNIPIKSHYGFALTVMGPHHSKHEEKPRINVLPWIQINLACEICLRDALLEILHDKKYNGLPKDETELHKRMVDFKRKHFESLKKILSAEQWEKLCPSNLSTCSSDYWDITLIRYVIQYDTDVPPPDNPKKWKVHKPNRDDNALGAWIYRAVNLRNNIKHDTAKGMENDKVCQYTFDEMERILTGLGYSKWKRFENIKNNEEEDKMLRLYDRLKTHNRSFSRSIHRLCKSWIDGLDQTVSTQEQGTSTDPQPAETKKSGILKDSKKLDELNLNEISMKKPGYVELMKNHYDKKDLEFKEKTTSPKKVKFSQSEWRLVFDNCDTSVKKDYSSSPAYLDSFGLKRYKIKTIILEDGNSFENIITYDIDGTNSSKSSIAESQKWDKTSSDQSLYHERPHFIQTVGQSMSEENVKKVNSKESNARNFQGVKTKDVNIQKDNGKQKIHVSGKTLQDSSNSVKETHNSEENGRKASLESYQSSIIFDLENRVKELERRSQEKLLDGSEGTPSPKRSTKAFGLFGIRASIKKKKRDKFNKTLTDVPVAMLLTPIHKPSVESFFKNDDETLRRIKQKLLDIEDLRRMANGQNRIRRDSFKENNEKFDTFERLLSSLRKTFVDCTVTNVIEAMQKLNIGATEIQIMRNNFTPQLTYFSSNEFEESDVFE